jgi:hypothetical protein
VSRWLLVPAAILALGALMPDPVWAQTTTPSPTPSGAVPSVLSQTLKNSVYRAYPNATTPEVLEFNNAVNDTLSVWLTQKWWDVLSALGYPQGGFVGGGGDFGGGGSMSGSWEETGRCDDFTWERDLDGNMMVPAMPLRSPTPIRPSQPLFMVDGMDQAQTNSSLSSTKVALHLFNQLPSTSDKAKQAPLFVQNQYTVVVSSPAYKQADGKIIHSVFRQVISAGNNYAWIKDDVGYGPGPDVNKGDGNCIAGIAFGKFNQGYKSCINPPTTWDIPKKTALLPTDSSKYIAANGQLGNCLVHPELMRWLAEALWKEAAKKPGYSGPAPTRVEAEDVQTQGTDPTVSDLDKSPTALPSPAPTGTPITQPTPTPTSTASPGPDMTDPGIQGPNPQSPTAESIVDAAFDWGFPAIEFNIGTGTCPTYTADFFGHTLTLDSHCPFIETNRALISAMMLIVFTFAAGVIVLRA